MIKNVLPYFFFTKNLGPFFVSYFETKWNKIGEKKYQCFSVNIFVTVFDVTIVDVYIFNETETQNETKSPKKGTTTLYV